MRWKTVALVAALALSPAYVAFHSLSKTQVPVLAGADGAVSYDKDGAMLLPANYREWIYLSSGIDMSYTDDNTAGHSTFDNVFVNPEAYQRFLKTGTWPDKTAFVLEAREARDRGSINLKGHYQGNEVKAIEVHVKDESRFPGKWAFFRMDPSTRKGTLFPPDASCYSCHSAHGAVDTTFVQFYPTLLPIAEQKHTLSPAFLKEPAAPGKQ